MRLLPLLLSVVAALASESTTLDPAVPFNLDLAEAIEERVKRTRKPTNSPTTESTRRKRTHAPTQTLTNEPTRTKRTRAPTQIPTNEPTRRKRTRPPTLSPTNERTRTKRTRSPTLKPTEHTGAIPTLVNKPTHAPSRAPTNSPTKTPTNNPTLAPTPNPKCDCQKVYDLYVAIRKAPKQKTTCFHYEQWYSTNVAECNHHECRILLDGRVPTMFTLNPKKTELFGFYCDYANCPTCDTQSPTPAPTTNGDCKVRRWDRWSECSRTCGGGTRVRNRTVTQEPKYGGKPCPHLSDLKKCNSHHCPVDCVQSVGHWDECSKSCGAGVQKYHRDVWQLPHHGGKHCSMTEKTRPCNHKRCRPNEPNCVVSKWGKWTACTKSCGTGEKHRIRAPIRIHTSIHECPTLHETGPCNPHTCPKDCIMSVFSKWSACSESCNSGTRKRTRFIWKNETFGGRKCPHDHEVETCNTQHCPRDCEVGMWGSWSAGCFNPVPLINGSLTTCKTAQNKWGEQTRKRPITTKKDFGGQLCPQLDDKRRCWLQMCNYPTPAPLYPPLKYECTHMQCSMTKNERVVVHHHHMEEHGDRHTCSFDEEQKRCVCMCWPSSVWNGSKTASPTHPPTLPPPTTPPTVAPTPHPCTDGSHVCEQTCFEADGQDYHCGCREGFQLETNGIGCALESDGIHPVTPPPTFAPTPILPDFLLNPDLISSAQDESFNQVPHGLDNLHIGDGHHFVAHNIQPDHFSLGHGENDDDEFHVLPLGHHVNDNLHPLGMLDLTHENSMQPSHDHATGLNTPVGIDGIDHAQVHANMEDLEAEHGPWNLRHGVVHTMEDMEAP